MMTLLFKMKHRAPSAFQEWAGQLDTGIRPNNGAISPTVEMLFLEREAGKISRETFLRNMADYERLLTVEPCREVVEEQRKLMPGFPPLCR